VYGLVARMQQPMSPAWWSRLPQLITAFVTVLGAGGVLAEAALGVLERLHAGGGVEAAAGTAVLALLAFVAAWMGPRWQLAELGWLVPPLLVGGGVKLVAMDLRYGAPAALFVSFVLYGAALSVAPRLLRSRKKELRQIKVLNPKVTAQKIRVRTLAWNMQHRVISPSKRSRKYGRSCWGSIPLEFMTSFSA